MSDWSDEETDDQTHADRPKFYKVEKWSRDGHRVVELVFAGTSLDKATRIFDRMTKTSTTDPADDPAAHAGVERMAAARDIALDSRKRAHSRQRRQATRLAPCLAVTAQQQAWRISDVPLTAIKGNPGQSTLPKMGNKGTTPSC